jgi:hypothetical protein
LYPSGEPFAICVLIHSNSLNCAIFYGAKEIAQFRLTRFRKQINLDGDQENQIWGVNFSETGEFLGNPNFAPNYNTCQ